MIRGALIGLLYSHALEARGSDDEENGRVVTLLSNDIGNVEKCGEMFHETWAQALEVAVGTLLLAREVGWLWPVPIVFIFCESVPCPINVLECLLRSFTVCSRVSRYVAIHTKAEQGKWNTATQQRISATSSILGAMKNIKMLGMQQTILNHVEDLRRQDMNAAKGVRWLMVAYNASGELMSFYFLITYMII